MPRSSCTHAYSLLLEAKPDADEVVADQIEQEAGGDSSEPPVFRLAHGARLLAPSKQTLDQFAFALREAVALGRVVRPSMDVLRACPVFVTYALTAMCGVMFFARRRATCSTTS